MQKKAYLTAAVLREMLTVQDCKEHDMSLNEVTQATTSIVGQAVIATGEADALRAEVSAQRARFGKIEIALNKSLARFEALESVQVKLVSRVAELELENSGLRETIQSLGNESEKRASRVAELELENSGLRQEIKNLKSQNEKLGKSLKNAERESKDTKRTLTRLRSSFSWRITVPLRYLGRAMNFSKK